MSASVANRGPVHPSHLADASPGCRPVRGSSGRTDDAVAVEIGVETHLDPAEQAGWQLVGVALAADRQLQFGLEVERLQAVHARTEVRVDVGTDVVGELPVEEGVELSDRFVAVRHDECRCVSAAVGPVVGPVVVRGVEAAGQPPRLGVPVQRTLHRFSSPMKSRHDGSDRDLHHFGDLLVREPFDIGEQHRQPEVVGEIFERLLHFVVGEQVEKLFLGRHRGGGGLHRAEPAIQVQLLDLAQLTLLRATLFGAVRVDVGVRQDAEQPSPQVGAFLEGVEASKPSQVCLLHQILCVGLVARHAQSGRVQLRCVLHRLFGEVLLFGHEWRHYPVLLSSAPTLCRYGDRSRLLRQDCQSTCPTTTFPTSPPPTRRRPRGQRRVAEPGAECARVAAGVCPFRGRSGARPCSHRDLHAARTVDGVHPPGPRWLGTEGGDRDLRRSDGRGARTGSRVVPPTRIGVARAWRGGISSRLPGAE